MAYKKAVSIPIYDCWRAIRLENCTESNRNQPVHIANEIILEKYRCAKVNPRPKYEAERGVCNRASNIHRTITIKGLEMKMSLLSIPEQGDDLLILFGKAITPKGVKDVYENSRILVAKTHLSVVLYHNPQFPIIAHCIVNENTFSASALRKDPNCQIFVNLAARGGQLRETIVITVVSGTKSGGEQQDIETMR